MREKRTALTKAKTFDALKSAMEAKKHFYAVRNTAATDLYFCVYKKDIYKKNCQIYATSVAIKQCTDKRAAYLKKETDAGRSPTLTESELDEFCPLHHNDYLKIS